MLATPCELESSDGKYATLKPFANGKVALFKVEDTKCLRSGPRKQVFAAN
jgi:hypothetical protein